MKLKRTVSRKGIVCNCACIVIVNLHIIYVFVCVYLKKKTEKSLYPEDNAMV